MGEKSNENNNNSITLNYKPNKNDDDDHHEVILISSPTFGPKLVAGRARKAAQIEHTEISKPNDVFSCLCVYIVCCF